MNLTRHVGQHEDREGGVEHAHVWQHLIEELLLGGSARALGQGHEVEEKQDVPPTEEVRCPYVASDPGALR